MREKTGRNGSTGGAGRGPGRGAAIRALALVLFGCALGAGCDERGIGGAPAAPRCTDPAGSDCCGNGIREGAEACDDANGSAGDGCLDDCSIARCPGGLVDPNDGCADLAGGSCDELPTDCGPADRACTIDPDELRRVVSFLADDAQEGRQNDSDASLRVQDYLVRELRTFALPGAADGGFRQPIERGTNLLARIPGSDPTTNEVVLVGAHYDHLGTRGDRVFHGATDDAAGVAAVLAVGRAIARLPRAPRRSVLLALWDREEDGLIGSGTYAPNPAVPLADTVAYLNFDIVGSAPLRGFRRNTVLVGLDTSPDFADLVARTVAGDPLVAAPLSNLFGQGRSDHEVFAGRGIPVLFFSDATGGCYHTPGDDESTVHYGKVLRSAWMGTRIVQALADGPTRPAFTRPGLPLFSDAVALRDLLRRSLCETGESGVGAAELAAVEQALATLDGIAAHGEEAFGGQDPVVVAQTALSMVELLTSLPCQRN